MLVLTYFKHAQPALLYLVPACIGLPLLVALVKGDIQRMFSYEDHPTPVEETEKSSKSSTKKDVTTVSGDQTPKPAKKEAKKSK